MRGHETPIIKISFLWYEMSDLNGKLEFFRIEIYRIYRMYRIYRRLFLFNFNFKITKNNIIK